MKSTRIRSVRMFNRKMRIEKLTDREPLLGLEGSVQWVDCCSNKDKWDQWAKRDQEWCQWDCSMIDRYSNRNKFDSSAKHQNKKHACSKRSNVQPNKAMRFRAYQAKRETPTKPTIPKTFNTEQKFSNTENNRRITDKEVSARQQTMEWIQSSYCSRASCNVSTTAIAPTNKSTKTPHCKKRICECVQLTAGSDSEG